MRSLRPSSLRLDVSRIDDWRVARRPLLVFDPDARPKADAAQSCPGEVVAPELVHFSLAGVPESPAVEHGCRDRPLEGAVHVVSAEREVLMKPAMTEGAMFEPGQAHGETRTDAKLDSLESAVPVRRRAESETPLGR